MKQIFVNTVVKSKTEYDQLTFLKELAALDYQLGGIELRNEYDAVEELTEEQISEYIELADENNWTYFLSIPGDLFTENGLRDDFNEIVQAASKLQVKNIKFNLGDANSIEKVNVEDFNRLLSENNLSITIENGQAETNGTIEVIHFAINKIEELGLEVGLTFDIGNWIVMHFNPQEAYDFFKENITIMHLKNTNISGDWMLLNEGDAQWTDFLETSVPYILEYPMTRDEFAREYDNLRRFLQ